MQEGQGTMLVVFYLNPERNFNGRRTHEFELSFVKYYRENNIYCTSKHFSLNSKMTLMEQIYEE